MSEKLGLWKLTALYRVAAYNKQKAIDHKNNVNGLLNAC